MRVRREYALAAILLGFCVLTLPMPAAAILGLPVAVLIVRWEPRQRSRSASVRHIQTMRDLPVVLDVLALSLDAGISWDRATRLASGCACDHMQDELTAAAGRLALGAAPDEVWRGAESLEAIGAVVERSFRSGGAVSNLLRQHADRLRADDRLRRISAVRRLETTILLPLTGLGLPAFLVAGVVPTIASMAMSTLPQLFSTGG